MAQQIQVIGLTLDEAKTLIKCILLECIEEVKEATKEKNEKGLSVAETCKYLGISRPTLHKYVEGSLLRRHDLGRKKKIFYLSEIQEDIKRIQISQNK
jgi:excisionase family DNA binding protein